MLQSLAQCEPILTYQKEIPQDRCKMVTLSIDGHNKKAKDSTIQIVQKSLRNLDSVEEHRHDYGRVVREPQTI